MARNEAIVQATPDEVFAVLADGWAYVDWVVGCQKIRSVDPGFPAVGKAFHHRVGLVGPVSLPDNSEVLVCEPGRKLVLQARARPMGTARVALELEPFGQGTRIIMDETAGDRLTRFTSLNPLVEPLVKLRNVESLRRLKVLAEKRHFAAA